MIKSIHEKGITLIALVITIIVLLILAGVTLSIVMKTGITDNALKAKDISQISSYKDSIEMVKTGEQIRKKLENIDTSLKDLVEESLKSQSWVSTVRNSEEESSLKENQIQVITKDNYIIVAEILENGTINYLVGDKYDGEPYPTISLKQLPLEGTENEKIKIEVTASVTKGNKTKNIEKIELINSEGTVLETKKCNNLHEEVIFNVDGNGIYEFKVTTNAEKTTSKKIFIDIHGTENIVQITPETTDSRNTEKEKGNTQNGIKTGPIQVTIEYGETDLIKEYQIGEGTEWQTTEKATEILEIDKNTSISARYSDGTNKFGTKSIEISNVDNVAPTIENVNATIDKATITVSADINDEASPNAGPDTKGIKEKLYSIDTEDYKEQNTFTVDTVGKHTIHIKAIDKAGNETITSKEVDVEGYKVTINKGEGIDTVSNGKTVIKGTILEITATLKTGYNFTGWEIKNGSANIASKTNLTTTITPESDVTIEATAKLANNAPEISSTSVSVVSRGTNNITVRATATDKDSGDKLTYKLYLRQESEKNYPTEPNYTSGEYTPGTAVNLPVSGLPTYTVYKYKVEVTDGKTTITSSEGTTGTGCPGTGLECTEGSTSTCSSTIKNVQHCVSTTSYDCYVISMGERCPTCGKYTWSTVELTCGTCGNRVIESWCDSLCSACVMSHDIITYSCSTHSYTGTSPSHTIYKYCSKHNLAYTHQYCDHGYVNQIHYPN